MNRFKPYHSWQDKLWPRVRTVRPSDRRILERIRRRSDSLQGQSSSQLLETSLSLRDRIAGGQAIDNVNSIIEAFSLASEALRRTHGKTYYDVQILGGLVLTSGSIAEMQTGEGKTITCGLAATLFGFTGRGTHIATTNAYLAARDFEELKPVFTCLGIGVGLLDSDMDVQEKRRAYQCDVTYGTGYEFGFDFLRDQLSLRNQRQLPLGTRFLSRLRGYQLQELNLIQRHHAYAIIDEADSVLIDEAATPLILSGTPAKSAQERSPLTSVYESARNTADQLVEERDFKIDRLMGRIELTSTGFANAADTLQGAVQSLLRRPWSSYVEQALYAEHLLAKDVDYVVKDHAITIVDQCTGRLHDERKWQSGLHQAVETKERLPATDEREVEARITRQRFFQFYDRVSGMTGTAAGNEKELLEFYELPVVRVPRNQPSQRKRLPSRYFNGQEAKRNAIVDDAIERSAAGQPVLIGTQSIAQSRELSLSLSLANTPHKVLNGVQDEKEASVISVAGQTKSITISTNMAGRGTDIRLDEASRDAGGLHVIVAEHQESSRVDRQLIGRCARQNDPGSYQFFTSADDQILQRFDESLANKIRHSSGSAGECKRPFEQEIRDLQKRIEAINYANRRKMVLHDQWIESAQKTMAKLA